MGQWKNEKRCFSCRFICISGRFQIRSYQKIYLSSIFLISLINARECLIDHNPERRVSRPEKDTLAISPAGYFYIHYDTTGSSAPDADDQNGNGVPDYVDEVALIADSAYHVLVNVLGYDEEPFDGEGGYDIYIQYYASDFIYGYNYKESGGTSYLEIDNDYGPQSEKSNFNLSPIQIMRISLAHEYFHGIQWGYEENLGDNAYFYEMTSMWFEDVIIPYGNDYIDGWTDDLLNNPTADFNNTGQPGYELALFGHYLSSFVDPKGVDTAKNSTIIREMWERYGNSSSNAFSSVKFVLDNSYNIYFIEAWVDFISRNLYNGIDESFYYYSDQALIDPIDTYPQGLSLGSTETFTLQLDDESVSIQSYELVDVATVYITHSSSDYAGLAASLSSGNIENSLLWGTNNTSFIANDEIHFIYGSENMDSVIINLFNSYPYNYSLLDININSETYGEILSPGYFAGQVTLHYFGHQN